MFTSASRTLRAAAAPVALAGVLLGVLERLDHQRQRFEAARRIEDLEDRLALLEAHREVPNA